MASRRSGGSRARTPADTISQELENRLLLDEGDDFSLIQPPSVVSSLEQLSVRGASRATGGESLISPPAGRAASLPGSIRGGGFGDGMLDTPRGSSSPQVALFIENATATRCCLGIIGSSGRFCVAPKARGLNHCGTVAHAKNKFTVERDAFYPPAGALLGRASAKQSPMIKLADIPRGMLSLFQTGAMSTTRWEAVFNEAIARGPSTPARGRRSRDTSPIEEHATSAHDGDDGEVSLDSSASDISLLDVDMDPEGRDTYSSHEWSTIIEEQRAAIEHLHSLIQTLQLAVPKVVHKLNASYRPGMMKNTREVNALKLTTEQFIDQVGSLFQLVSDHGSLSQAVNVALASGDSTIPLLHSLEEQMQAFADELADCADQTDQSKETLLSLINRVSAASTKRSDTLENRVLALEATPHRRSSLGTSTPLVGGLTPDTSFGHVTIGTTSTELTMNAIVNQLTALKSRIQAVAERSRSTGVVFQRLAFGSEPDFGFWYLSNHPSGEGPAAFVDIVSIWSFASTESGASEWLVDLHRSQSIGFKASPDTVYAHSMTTRYPRVFVGKVDSILSSQTIKMLEPVDAWRGNGMGDGFKERLLDQLQYAVQSHSNYCEDYLPDGPVRQAALRTAQVTQHFFQSLVAYLDDELAMLTSFNLPPKQTLLLLSNQVVHICDDLFEFRNQAKGVDVSNRAATATRYAWVTLQALGCMDSYLREKFRKHPGINSTYMRFLTRNLADQSAIGLKAKLEALATKVTKVETSVTAASTKVALEKLDGKLELIIRANSLKRTSG